MALAPGTRLGPYDVQSLIGAGAMGEVYAARDRRLGRELALKLLPAHLTADAGRVRRFAHEALATSALNHPNIVTIYDVGEEAGVRFIAMELVKGRTLRALGPGPIPVDSVLAWGLQIAAALAMAHTAGVVHRDIKPENVMVRDDGYVKVLDFGLAQLTDARSASLSATHPSTSPGTLLGTLRYMSPEQARGDAVDGASDVYALGTVLYELVTGRHPLVAGSLLELLQAIAQQAPPPASRTASAIPRLLDELLECMLSKDPGARPAPDAIVATLRGLAPAIAGASYTARAETMAGPSARSTHRATRSLVGRARERAMLRQAFDAARLGRGALLCLTGEPGIGKTASVEAFFDELADSADPCLIGQGRCSERLAGTEAYLPWLEALETLNRGTSAISSTIRRVAPTWFAQLTWSDDEGTPLAPLLTDLPSTSPERMKRELVALLETVSARQPLVLFFDDLHWADVSTIDLLAFVAHRLSSMHLLIVATYRPSDARLARHAFLQIKPELQARGICRECRLEFLTLDDTAAYLGLEFPGHRFPVELASLIHARTEGNPLFMADLARDLRDQGVIARDQDGWMLVRPLPEVNRDFPESVRGMIERKIAQLSDEDRALLVVASVRGYRFESTVVATAMGVEVAIVEERLSELDQAHGFVRLLDESDLADRSLTLRCQFVHVLYQTALYATLTPTRRASLSRAVAEALIAHGETTGKLAAELAHLFETARLFDRAAQHLQVAAEHAIRVCANHEALALADRGMSALRSAPGAADRARQDLAFRLIVGSSLSNLRGYASPDAKQAYTDVLEVARRMEDTSAIHHGLWGLALYHLIQADYARTHEFGVELLELGGRTRDPATLATAHYVLGTVSLYRGEVSAARAHYEEGIATCDSQRERPLTLPDGRNLAVSCRAQLSRVLWLIGVADQALAASRTAQSAADDAQPLDVAFTLFLDALLHQMMGDTQATADRAARLLQVATEHELAQYRIWATILRAWAGAMAGVHGAIDDLREGLALQGRMASVLSRPHFLALFADALRLARRPDEGLAAVDEALRYVERTGERYYEAEVHRLKGELLRVRDSESRDAAVESFQLALTVAERQGAAALALKAAESLVRATEGSPESDLAREQLLRLRGQVTDSSPPPV